MNVDIITEKITILHSLGNQDRKTLKAETEKMKDVFANIPTNNITEINELIYAEAKLVCEIIRFPLKNTNIKSIPGWEIRL